MIALLQAVATAKHLTGQDVTSWSTKVHNKLRRVGINTVKDMVSGSMVLNQKLRRAGLQMMHRQTLDLFTLKGVEILTAASPTSDMPSVNDDVILASDTPLKPSYIASGVPSASDTPLDDTHNGKCRECNGSGPSGEPCTYCKEEGVIYLNFLAGL
jgi:hypothetical protein